MPWRVLRLRVLTRDMAIMSANTSTAESIRRGATIRVVAMVMLALAASLTAVRAFAGTQAQVCASKKQKAAAKLGAAYLACSAKAVAKSAPVDTACQAKAGAKFEASFAKIEAAGGCVTVGDASSISSYAVFTARAIAALEPNALENCTNNADDNGNGQIDCSDVTCFSNSSCVETYCADGIDSDQDGRTDCDDEDCLNVAACVESDCVDGVDNDRDGQTDCGDADCFNYSNCNTCGDAIRQGLESCDGTDLGGATCNSLGYAGGGALTCFPFCAFDVRGCIP